jgi:hypothetical protein
MKMTEQEIIEAIKNGKKIEYKVGVIDGENKAITEHIWIEHKGLNNSYSSLAEKLTKHEFRIKTFEWRFKSVETFIKNGLKIYSGDDEGFFIAYKEGYGIKLKWSDLKEEVNPGLHVGLVGLIENLCDKIEL